MKAIVMAGGNGTRLRPLTENTPKPLIPVCGRPCISYALDMLADAGISEVTLTVRYRAEDIINALGDSWRGMKLEYMIENEPLGTAGSVKACAEFLRGEETFVVTSADSVCSMDLARAIEFHNQRKADATLLLARTSNVLEYGVVVTAKDARIIKFIEKPAWGQAFSDTVNSGTYIFDRKALDMIPPSEEYDFGRGLLPKMEHSGSKIFGYEASGFWYDIGDPEQYLECSVELNGGSYVSETAKVEFGSLVLDSVVMDGASVGRGASLEHCIIAPGEAVPAGISLRYSLWSGGRAINILRITTDYDLGLSLAAACGGGRIGVGGRRRGELLRGISDGGGNARDLGDADARLCAFAAREYGLDCSVWAAKQTIIFDEQGLAASRKFTRSLKDGKRSEKPGTVTALTGLASRYVYALSSSIDRIDGTRFYSEDPYVREALEKQGGICDPSSGLVVEDGLSGLDLWHLCAIIIANERVDEIALPYIAPAALVDFAFRRGVSVRRYAIVPFDESEAGIRSLVREQQWLCDEGTAAVKVIGIIHKTGRTLDELKNDIPDFGTGERDVRASAKDRLTVMKRFGTPDGEGVVRVYSKGRVRALPDARGIRLIAEAVSVEAANELAGISAKEIEKLTGGNKSGDRGQ